MHEERSGEPNTPCSTTTPCPGKQQQARQPGCAHVWDCGTSLIITHRPGSAVHVAWATCFSRCASSDCAVLLHPKSADSWPDWLWGLSARRQHELPTARDANMANSKAPTNQNQNQHNVPRKAEEVEPDVDANYSKMLFYAVETIYVRSGLKEEPSADFSIDSQPDPDLPHQ